MKYNIFYISAFHSKYQENCNFNKTIIQFNIRYFLKYSQVPRSEELITLTNRDRFVDYEKSKNKTDTNYLYYNIYKNN